MTPSNWGSSPEANDSSALHSLHPGEILPDGIQAFGSGYILKCIPINRHRTSFPTTQPTEDLKSVMLSNHEVRACRASIMSRETITHWDSAGPFSARLHSFGHPGTPTHGRHHRMRDPSLKGRGWGGSCLRIVAALVKTLNGNQRALGQRPVIITIHPIRVKTEIAPDQNQYQS